MCIRDRVVDAHVDPAQAFGEGQPDPQEAELPVRHEQAHAQGHREGGVAADEGEFGAPEPPAEGGVEHLQALVLAERPRPPHEFTQRHIHEQRQPGGQRGPDERGDGLDGGGLVLPAGTTPAPQDQEHQGQQDPVLPGQAHDPVQPRRSVPGRSVDLVQQADIHVRPTCCESSHGDAAPCPCRGFPVGRTPVCAPPPPLDQPPRPWNARSGSYVPFSTQ